MAPCSEQVLDWRPIYRFGRQGNTTRLIWIANVEFSYLEAIF